MKYYIMYPIFLVLIFCEVGRSAVSDSNTEIRMSDYTSQYASTNSITYIMPKPVEKMTISYERDKQGGKIIGVSLRYGNNRSVSIASNMLECLPNPMPELTTFLYQSADFTKSGWEKDWSTSFSFPYGHGPDDYLDEDRAAAIGFQKLFLYPNIEIHIVNFKIDSILIRKDKDHTKTVSGDFRSCPAEQVNWPLSK